jgi:hypothetical protein
VWGWSKGKTMRIEAKQKRINSIIARALAFIRNGQQKEALRELAKEELKDISEARTTKEF